MQLSPYLDCCVGAWCNAVISHWPEAELGMLLQHELMLAISLV
jgi:hypothetical protein